jgi:hypothetical protein
VFKWLKEHSRLKAQLAIKDAVNKELDGMLTAASKDILALRVERNELMDELRKSRYEHGIIHGMAVDYDVQVSDMRGAQQGMKNSIKWEAQDRAAAAILELHALPSGIRVTRAIKDKLEKMIADVADKI